MDGGLEDPGLPAGVGSAGTGGLCPCCRDCLGRTSPGQWFAKAGSHYLLTAPAPQLPDPGLDSERSAQGRLPRVVAEKEDMCWVSHVGQRQAPGRRLPPGEAALRGDETEAGAPSSRHG